MKQKFKKFFTLDHRKSDGFTLVELIVVIAILAILGGATVPAYNLYIKKARESADNQVIAAVNTAFASACLENKLELADVQSASVKVDGGVVQGLASVNPSADADEIKEAFLRYMEGNSNTKFKTEPVNTLQWKADKGSFEILTLALKYGNAVLNADALAAILGSNFADMGSDGIIDMLDSNIGTFKKILNAIGNPWLSAILNQFGVSDATTASLTGSLADGGALSAVLSKEKREEISAGLAKKTGAEYEKAANEYSNAMVLLAAEKLTAPGTSADGFTQQLKNSSDPSEALKTLVGSEGMANQMVNTAVTTAMENSYKQSDTYSSAYEEYKNTVPGYKQNDYYFQNSTAYEKAYDQYLTNEEGAKDMQALVGSMQLVSDNKNIIGESELLSNGVKDQGVKDILNTAIPTN